MQRVRTHIHTHTVAHTSVHVHLHTHTHMYIHIQVHTCTCTRTQIIYFMTSEFTVTMTEYGVSHRNAKYGTKIRILYFK
jgi:hypothetical protein